MKDEMSEQEKAARDRYQALPPEDRCFIVVKGLPQRFGDLVAAEQWAAEKTELDHEDRTVLCVPRHSIQGLVARYHGVVLHALHEVKEEEEC